MVFMSHFDPLLAHTIWCCKLVWAQTQGPLGTMPRGLRLVPSWLGNVPTALDSPDWGSHHFWHIVKLGVAQLKLLANQ